MPATLRQCAIDALSRLTRPFFQGTAILAFHRVLPTEEKSPLAIPRDLEISPGFLEAIIGMLRAEGYRFTTLDEVIQATEETPGRRLCTVTFDDGYLDNLTYAVPLLQRLEAPFTVYVNSSFTDGRGRPWWHTLQDLILRNDHLCIRLGDSPIEVPLDSHLARDRAFNDLYYRLKARTSAEKVSLLDAWTCDHPGNQQAGHGAPFLSWDDLRNLHSSGLVEIGNHTATHPFLPELDRESVTAELAACRDRVRVMTGLETRHLSYPFGATDHPVIDTVRGLGFRSAVTTQFRMIRKSRPHPFDLPRLGFGGDVEEPRLARRALRGVYRDCWR